MKNVEWRIECYETVDSTNSEAWRLAKDGAPEGTVVFAQEQTAGRGQGDHKWHSPNGANIYASIILRPDVPIDVAPQLTQVAGLAIRQAIADYTGLEPVVKWPNDILLHYRKVCGILCEMSTGIEKRDIPEFVIVGFGINVGQQVFPLELEDIATSLEAEACREIGRRPLLDAVLEHFTHYYEIFTADRSFAALQAEYDRYLI